MKFVIISCVALRCIQVATKRKPRRRRESPVHNSVAAPSAQFLFFYTSWCPHCESAKPEIEKVKARHPSIEFSDVDVEKDPAMASFYQIKSVPTFVALMNGKEVDRRQGFANASQLEQMAKKIQSAGPPLVGSVGPGRLALRGRKYGRKRRRRDRVQKFAYLVQV